jgi:enolase-phosphatase E1
MAIRAILTDIEGTTSSIAFVAETLFPYARDHLAAFIADHPALTAPILAEVQAEVPGDPIATLTRWIDEDRKTPPLKTLQGVIWAQGYAEGTLQGHVYPDAAAMLRKWNADGIALYVFSSGSIAAQKLIFGHSIEGDLSHLFSGWFDLSTGSKREAESYAIIARAIGLVPASILFLSDSREEIDAAAAAGFATRLIDRTRGESFRDILVDV